MPEVAGGHNAGTTNYGQREHAQEQASGTGNCVQTLMKDCASVLVDGKWVRWEAFRGGTVLSNLCRLCQVNCCSQEEVA